MEREFISLVGRMKSEAGFIVNKTKIIFSKSMYKKYLEGRGLKIEVFISKEGDFALVVPSNVGFKVKEDGRTGNYTIQKSGKLKNFPMQDSDAITWDTRNNGMLIKLDIPYKIF